MNIYVKKNSLITFILLLVVFLGCKPEDPVKEVTPELITKAMLTFATVPVGTDSDIVVTATDPDAEGVKNIKVDGPINLVANKVYSLKIVLINELASPSDPAYNISDEVRTQGAEHQFFFSWTNNSFSDPVGDGNIDNKADPVNYAGGVDSKDVNGRNLGLTTTWSTSTSGAATGTFRILLKHQPGLKSDTSDSQTGETDLDLSFVINVQ